MPDRAQELRLALAQLTGLGGASPVIADIAQWIVELLPRLITVWSQPGFYGFVQLTFENGELTEVPVLDRGQRAKHKRGRG